MTVSNQVFNRNYETWLAQPESIKKEDMEVILSFSRELVEGNEASKLPQQQRVATLAKLAVLKGKMEPLVEKNSAQFLKLQFHNFKQVLAKIDASIQQVFENSLKNSGRVVLIQEVNAKLVDIRPKIAENKLADVVALEDLCRSLWIKIDDEVEEEEEIEGLHLGNAKIPIDEEESAIHSPEYTKLIELREELGGLLEELREKKYALAGSNIEDQQAKLKLFTREAIGETNQNERGLKEDLKDLQAMYQKLERNEFASGVARSLEAVTPAFESINQSLADIAESTASYELKIQQLTDFYQGAEMLVYFNLAGTSMGKQAVLANFPLLFVDQDIVAAHRATTKDAGKRDKYEKGLAPLFQALGRHPLRLEALEKELAGRIQKLKDQIPLERRGKREPLQEEVALLEVRAGELAKAIKQTKTHVDQINSLQGVLDIIGPIRAYVQLARDPIFPGQTNAQLEKAIKEKDGAFSIKGKMKDIRTNFGFDKKSELWRGLPSTFNRVAGEDFMRRIISGVLDELYEEVGGDKGIAKQPKEIGEAISFLMMQNGRLKDKMKRE